MGLQLAPCFLSVPPRTAGLPSHLLEDESCQSQTLARHSAAPASLPQELPRTFAMLPAKARPSSCLPPSIPASLAWSLRKGSSQAQQLRRYVAVDSALLERSVDEHHGAKHPPEAGRNPTADDGTASLCTGSCSPLTPPSRRRPSRVQSSRHRSRLRRSDPNQKAALVTPPECTAPPGCGGRGSGRNGDLRLPSPPCPASRCSARACAAPG
mmetsp:Transcript_84396/g.117305  ORF Transcript_84396/g.117305 Transcript_84396/m.117305 type:complete len:211 (+) Transcript_84396:308-940(+)